MKIAVIGLGKIGLPLAVQYARKGHDVIGIDINSKTIDLINNGIEPFPEEANLQEYLSEVVAIGKLRATLNYEAVSNIDTIVVAVPLFVNEKSEPDFKDIDSATANIGKYLKRGAIVCFETTLPIGTTRNRFAPILEKKSGMKIGVDFYLVYSPERVLTGRIFEDLRKYPKIVGGITEVCSQQGMTFYQQVLDFDDRPDLPKPNGVWNLDSAESAEFVKLAETTYRDVNIGLANQFAKYADAIGVNIYEVIQAANSQNFSHIHQPGISVGGHCIPVYPRFYLWNDKNASIVREARETNRLMPLYAIEQLENELGLLKSLNILVLGISYRANVKEAAFSGVFDLVKEIERRGARAFVSDPLYTDAEIEKLGLIPFSGDESIINAIVVHTDDSSFSAVNFRDFPQCKAIYDGRNLYSNLKSGKDIKIYTLGNHSNGEVKWT